MEIIGKLPHQLSWVNKKHGQEDSEAKFKSSRCIILFHFLSVLVLLEQIILQCIPITEQIGWQFK